MNRHISRRTILTTAALAGASLLPNASFAGAPARGLTRSDWLVSGPDGARVGVREVRGRYPTGLPVVLVHGARVPGVPSFDLPVPGGSLAAELAHAGHRVFIVDARGYGASSRPAPMDEPPQDNPPVATGDDVVADLAVAVDEIRARTDARAVAMLGWATGGHWAAWYASVEPRKVSHLIVYNSLYGAIDGHPTLGRGSVYEDPDNPGEFDDTIGAYRLTTGPQLFPSWDSSIPVDDKDEWRDPRVAAAYADASLASDPSSFDREPPSFRAPTGALKDSFTLATGRQLWNAHAITARTFVVRSELDFWSRAEDVPTLAADLTAARAVVTAELRGATHYAHLDRREHGRADFLGRVLDWLG